MEGRAESGIEIRRILLLTRLRNSPKGMTMSQIVKDCGRIEGWNFANASLLEEVRQVLQSLINDSLVAVKTRFLITVKGEEYLADPLKWRLKVEASEEVEGRLFWSSIYDVFDRALVKLLLRSQEKKPE